MRLMVQLDWTDIKYWLRSNEMKTSIRINFCDFRVKNWIHKLNQTLYLNMLFSVIFNAYFFLIIKWFDWNCCNPNIQIITCTASIVSSVNLFVVFTKSCVFVFMNQLNVFLNVIWVKFIIFVSMRCEQWVCNF